MNPAYFEIVKIALLIYAIYLLSEVLRIVHLICGESIDIRKRIYDLYSIIDARLRS